ncbi:MAG: hypothetical protein U9R58_02940 [Chloroflexota bacterium]|nr:hypothetical protein [Chloroflexota bacterium]
MPLLTIFSAPKPFTDPHIDTIQRNAIQSWLHLGSEVEVILIGEEPGLEQVAAEYGVKLLMNVERNEKGTPLVSSIFKLAHQASNSSLLVYVNADILLLPDIVGAARKVSELVDKFLVVGQRWDLEVRELIHFSEGWEQRLFDDVNQRGSLHLPAGSDYFIFPRQLFTDIPNFAIGRAGWDNWMIYYARQQDWLVVDGTPSIMVIHQDHDYGHLPGGKPHYTLEESLDNEALAGGSANLYMVLDCEKQLRDGRLSSPSITLVRSLRRAEVWLTPADGVRQGRRWRLARSLRRTRRKITGTL